MYEIFFLLSPDRASRLFSVAQLPCEKEPCRQNGGYRDGSWNHFQVEIILTSEKVFQKALRLEPQMYHHLVRV